MGVSPPALLRNSQQAVFRERQESEIAPVRGKGGPLTTHVLELHWEELGSRDGRPVPNRRFSLEIQPPGQQ